MGRISREVMFMHMARAASFRSTCFRLNVGAIVVQENNPIAVGWNGQEPGAPHCAGNDCPGIVPGHCGTLHAETNALKKAAALIGENQPIDLYCTDSPCPHCVEFMRVETPLYVKRIFYEKPYRLSDHLESIRGVTEVYLVTPAGYIVDHFTRKVVELI